MPKRDCTEFLRNLAETIFGNAFGYEVMSTTEIARKLCIDKRRVYAFLDTARRYGLIETMGGNWIVEN